MDLTEYNFELFERINQYDNDRIDVVKMVVNPDTGVFIALRLPDTDSDYITIKTEVTPDDNMIADHNRNQYFRCNYLLTQNSLLLNERAGTNGKINLRIVYLKQVRQRYLDWFRRNDIKINNSELTRIASQNNINTDNINLDSSNSRMIAVISVLDTLNGEEISGKSLLINVDNILGTQTSYMKISEIFKINRNLFQCFVTRPRKGYYKLIIN